MTSLAFVFPGQGSQEVGMLADLAAVQPLVAETFAEAGAAIGLDLWALAQQGPVEELNRTAVTQPALLAASVALWRVWCAEGGSQPAMMAGHSLGEYSALVCAGALSFADGVRLVHRRGELMQGAVARDAGAMAAVLGLEDSQVEACCAAVDAALGTVSAANYNSPGQVVIAGASAAVDAAVAACKGAGAKRAMRLAVSVPSHCALMAPAAEAFAAVLDDTAIGAPMVPVVQNVAARPEQDPAAIRQALVAQLSNPVQWTGCVQAMASQGVATLIECGPGKVLAGLARRIDRSLVAYSINSPAGLAEALGADRDNGAAP